MNLEIGATVGDYQIVGILGAGGMGKVYKVRNLISDRIEAMKVLLPDLATEPELADRFLREIKVQASLEHPNIASLRTALRVDNQLLMLMEFVEGETLEQSLKNGPLAVERAVDYISQALSALDYAHQQGVVHRDIKPANMMLTTGGVVKLMDFGIAKAANDRRLTMTGTTMGSLYYMSPEQIQGAAGIDSRSDLYSLGVSLYELATGRRPFDGDSQFAIMSAHLEKTPVPPVEIDPRLPQGLNDVILMSVAKDPNSRFQTAGAFRAALRSVIPMAAPAAVPMAAAPAPPQAITMPVGPPPAVAPLAAQPKSKRGLWMALGALAAALAAVAAIQFGPWKGANAAQVPPAQPAASAAAQTPATQPTPAQSAPTEQAASPQPVPETAPAQTAVKTQSKAPKQVAKAEPVTPTPTKQATFQPVPAPQQAAPQPVTPQPVQQAPAQASNPAPAPNRVELQTLREQLVMLDARASDCRASIQSLQRQQAASGLNISSRFTEPARLMDSFMRGASDALKAGDTTSTKDFLEKAERQVAILEKLFNK